MVITAFKTGFQRLTRNAHLLGWLYAINIGFALVVALPLQSLLENKVGQSLGIQRLIPNFDYTIIRDFMREYGSELAVIFQEAQVVLLLYFVLSIFLAGGILEKVRFSPTRTFLQGSGQHFWRMLRLTIYFMLIYVVLIIVLGSIFQFIFITNFANFTNERPVVHGAGVFVGIFFILAVLVSMVQDYAKIQLVQHPEQSVFKSFWQTWGITFKNLTQTLPLYLINALLLLMVFGLYWWLSGYLHPINTSGKIILTFLLSQVFLIARIGIKLLNLASATVLYEKQLDQ
ncbi:MAG: hypothetical protein AB8G22_16945 [Saprospiraceae bacterium]